MTATRSLRKAPVKAGAAGATKGVNIALIAVFAALIAAFALVPGFMIGPVPFSMTIVIVLLGPLVLGAWQGSLAALLYVAAGLFGLPVFAGGSSGVAVLLGPTGGYLVGYVLAALIAGPCATLVLRRVTKGTAALVGLTLAAVAGLLVLHAAGVAGLMINAAMTFSGAFGTTIGFFGLDLLKAVIAGIAALAIVRAFPRVRGRRP